jgi:hypothetical protein
MIRRRRTMFRENIMKTRKVSAARSRFAFWFFLLPLLLVLRGTAFAAVDKTLYDEALAPGWQNWSWAAVDMASTAAWHSGTVSIAVTPTAWSALYLRSTDAPLDTNGYLNFTFWVNGGATGGQTIQGSPWSMTWPNPASVSHRRPRVRGRRSLCR